MTDENSIEYEQDRVVFKMAWAGSNAGRLKHRRDARSRRRFKYWVRHFNRWAAKVDPFYNALY